MDEGRKVFRLRERNNQGLLKRRGAETQSIINGSLRLCASAFQYQFVYPKSDQLRAVWRPLLLIVSLGVGLRLGLMWIIWANGGSPLMGDEGNYILSALPLSEGRGIPDLW